MKRDGRRTRKLSELSDEISTREEKEEFWKGIFENGIPLQEREMINEMRRSHQNIRRVEIKEEEVEWEVKFVPNWKASGLNKIQGFWIKYLDVKKLLHKDLETDG